MRIIAGTARGLRLQSFEGKDIRPTLDRVRESLFNILGTKVNGAYFLDLFSGTGANGIEALSRGAEQAVFVDANTTAIKLIRDNLNRTRLTAARLMQLQLPRDIRQIPGKYDIIYADPPFGWNEHTALLDAIATQGLCAEQGILIVEHPSKLTLGEEQGMFEKYRLVRYGNTSLSFFALTP